MDSTRYTFTPNGTSAASDGRAKYCEMGPAARGESGTCTESDHGRKWGNSVARLMADSWQKICFIWPICIKVASAITRARQRDKLKKANRAVARRRRWAYNKSPVQIGVGENLKKAAAGIRSCDCWSTGWGNDCFITRTPIVLSSPNPFYSAQAQLRD